MEETINELSLELRLQRSPKLWLFFRQQIFGEKSFCRQRQEVFKISFEEKRLYVVHQIKFE
jgi:hypothetical protein